MNFQDDKFKRIFWIMLVVGFLIAFKNPIAFLILIFLVIFLIKKLNINTDNMNIYNNGFGNLKGILKKGTGLVLFVVVLILLLPLMVVIIDTGETGVYSLFGKVRDAEYASGFHLKNPLAKINRLSIRTEDYTMSGVDQEGKKQGVDSIQVLTKEGLEVALDITVLYRLDEEKASDVYREVGNDYEEKLLRPIIRSSIRGLIAQYDIKVVYSEKRAEIEKRIFDDLERQLGGRGFVLEELLLRNVKLPMDLQKSIEQKLQAEQEAEKMEFVLIKEEKERERKVIEARGQKESQEIINQSLTPNYLNYLYIKNLQDREGTIYVPLGSNGLPLFKNIQ